MGSSGAPPAARRRRPAGAPARTDVEEPPAARGEEPHDDHHRDQGAERRTAGGATGRASGGRGGGARNRAFSRDDRAAVHRHQQPFRGRGDRADVVVRPEGGLHVLREDLLEFRVGDLDVVALPVPVGSVVEGDHEEDVRRPQAARLGRRGREVAGDLAAERVRVPDPELGAGRLLEVVESRLDAGRAPAERADVVRDGTGQAVRRRGEDRGEDRQQEGERDHRGSGDTERLAPAWGRRGHRAPRREGAGGRAPWRASHCRAIGAGVGGPPGPTHYTTPNVNSPASRPKSPVKTRTPTPATRIPDTTSTPRRCVANHPDRRRNRV